MAFAALVFDFDVVGIEEIPGLAKLDHVAGDVDETGEADAAILGREADEDTEGIGIGDGQDPHAHGGVVDEKALVGFLTSFSPPWNLVRIQGQARWSAMQAILLIREHQAAFDALVEVLEQGKGDSLSYSQSLYEPFPSWALILSNLALIFQSMKVLLVDPLSSHPLYVLLLLFLFLLLQMSVMQY